MTVPGLLFLCGGSESMPATASEFVAAAGGREARILFLMQSCEGWEEHAPEYVDPIGSCGASTWDVVAPIRNGSLDVRAVRELLARSTGILIGGGQTPVYQALYATGPARALIRDRHVSGVPLLGVSAGAAIAPELCAPTSADDESSAVASGLGLLEAALVAPHFEDPARLSRLVEAMARSGTKTGWGIPSASCAVFRDGRFLGRLGEPVYEIAVRDASSRAARVEERTRTFSSGGRA